MPQQKPSVGRIVHVPVDPATSNGATVAPAVITRVWSDSTVNVRVLHDGESITWRTSVVYREDLADVQGAAAVWTWPERV